MLSLYFTVVTSVFGSCVVGAVGGSTEEEKRGFGTHVHAVLVLSTVRRLYMQGLIATFEQSGICTRLCPITNFICKLE
jgi:hypothetical protein